MKPGLNKFLNKAQWILLPFSLLYGFVVIIRNKLFDWQLLPSKQFEIPFISVGNITVGGTGKTPHVEYLAKLFQQNTAVLSRGYGRKTKGFRTVHEYDQANNVGDEPLQIKSKFPDIHVAVCENRVFGAERLMSIHDKLQLVILDDAFQHRYIKPGLSIVLINYNRLIYNDFLLPVGRLREPIKGLRRAQMAIVSKCPGGLTHEEKKNIENRLVQITALPVFFSAFKYGTPIGVFTNMELKQLMDQHILLVTGIADPSPLKKYLNTKRITEIHYPDHYYFKESDVKQILYKLDDISDVNKIIITTEKDVQRFKQFQSLFSKIQDKFFYVPIEVEFLFDEKEKFNDMIFSYVEEGKTSR